MATIVTRAGKGAPLTHTEVDANFTNLNNDKVETSAISAFGATLVDDADAAAARTTLGLGTAATTASTDYVNVSGDTMTGDLTIPDKIIHSGDTNTSIRFPANDTFTVETAGSERMRIDSSGNVGIGTSSWRGNSLLRIAEPDNSTVAIELGKTGTNTNRFSRLGFTHYAGDTEEPVAGFNFFADSTRNLVQIGGGSSLLNTATEVRFFTAADNTTTTGTERMRINSSGNVGIGTQNPTRKLDVAGDVQVVGTGDGAPCLSLTSGETFNNGSNIVPRVPTGGLINIESGRLKIWPDLDGDGDYDADIWADSNFYLAASSRTHIRSNIPSSGGAGSNEGRLVIGATDTTNYIQSAKNFSGSERKDFAIGDYNSTDWWAYFDQSAGGLLGIGTSAPDARVHVVDAAATVGVFENNSGTTARVGFRGVSQVDNATAAIGVDSSGRLVMRGTGTDHIKIGGGAVQSAIDGSFSLGSASFRFDTVYASSGTINTSDAREKTEPQPIADDVLDAWGDVQLVTFKWLASVAEKGDLARTHFGVIAQQVRDAFLARGIDGVAYGILCYDEWGAEPATEDSPAVEPGNRWGIRPDQCMFLEAAYQRRRSAKLEARVRAIEEMLNGRDT